jgi:hypothetical protein
MKTVNPHFLDVLLRPLIGLADDDEATAHFSTLDPDSAEQVRHVIRTTLAPAYVSLPEEMREPCKTALAYYLSRPDTDFERIFDACLPPFSAPQTPRDFFVWLWRELFGEEDYTRCVADGFREIDDIEEPNRIDAQSRNSGRKIGDDGKWSGR